MIITITGPRSVGKSTISKIVARKIRLKYVSSDKIGDKALKKIGGLNKAIKSGLIKEIVKNKGYNLIIKEYNKDNFVFDLSGGSFAYTDFPKATKEVRDIAKQKSIVIGLLPFKDESKSVKLLFEREKQRKHLSEVDPKGLFERTKRRYKNFPLIFKNFCDNIIYTENKNPESIAEEIVSLLKNSKKV